MRFNVNGLELSSRQCQRSDREFVLGLYKKTLFRQVAEYHVPSVKMFDERFYADYKHKRILLRGKRRIGMYQVGEFEDKLVIKGLFISLSYQGKGIGACLMDHFEQLARKKSLNLELQVWDNNPAVGFYKKHGFRIMSKEGHKYRMLKDIS